jgi:hypothetical protein
MPKIAYGSPRGYSRRERVNPKITALISALVEAGEIRAEREQFAKMSEPPKLYPINWVPPSSRLRRYDPPLKIYQADGNA